MEEEICGYGVFESVDGEVFVGYYTKDIANEICPENFYETELEAAYEAIALLNEVRNG